MIKLHVPTGGAGAAPRTIRSRKRRAALRRRRRGWYTLTTTLAVVAAFGAAVMLPDGAQAGTTGWSAQTSGVYNELLGVYFFNATTGWAVGNGGEIVATTNAGSTWTKQTSATTSNALNDVHFVSALEGWAVGDSGTIIHTTDGGSSWSTQTSGVSGALYGVYFLDKDNGWIVGAETDADPSTYNSIVLHTMNGGANWSSVSGVGCQNLREVVFNGSPNGVIVGNGGDCWRTTNSGASWSKISVGTGQNILDLDFIDGDTGYALCMNGYVYATADGGATWTAKGDSTSSFAYGFAFPTADKGWVGDSAGSITASTDSGDSWTAQASTGTDRLDAICFPSATRGWTVGMGGKIYSYVGYDAPTVAISGDDSDWHPSSVDLTVTATVDSALTLSALEYSTDSGSTWNDIPGTGSSRTLTISANGTTDVSVRATDSNTNTATDSATVKIDSTEPTIDISGADSDWHAGAVTLTFPFSCGSSHVSSVEYRVNDGSWTTMTASKEYTVDIATEGVNTVSCRMTNGAGVTSEVASCTVKIGTTFTPTIAVSGNDDAWHTGPVALTFTPTVGTCGVASLEYRRGDGSWTTISKTDGAYTATISGDGEHAVSYRVTDNAGAVSAVGSCTVRVDATRPTLGLAKGDITLKKGANAKLRLKLKGSDAVSRTCRLCVVITRFGQQKSTVVWTDVTSAGGWQTLSLPWKLGTGHYNLHLSLYDAAGSFSRASAMIVVRR